MFYQVNCIHFFDDVEADGPEEARRIALREFDCSCVTAAVVKLSGEPCCKCEGYHDPAVPCAVPNGRTPATPARKSPNP
jgi:hypothetical protein